MHWTNFKFGATEKRQCRHRNLQKKRLLLSLQRYLRLYQAWLKWAWNLIFQVLSPDSGNQRFWLGGRTDTVTGFWKSRGAWDSLPGKCQASSHCVNANGGDCFYSLTVKFYKQKWSCKLSGWHEQRDHDYHGRARGERFNLNRRRLEAYSVKERRAPCCRAARLRPRPGGLQADSAWRRPGPARGAAWRRARGQGLQVAWSEPGFRCEVLSSQAEVGG
jgi:hypothetical protein